MATRAIEKCRVLFNAAAAVTGVVKPLTGMIKPVLKQFAGGSSEISRCQAVKKVWDYIKADNLPSPSNKREIICDRKLKMLATSSAARQAPRNRRLAQVRSNRARVRTRELPQIPAALEREKAWRSFVSAFYFIEGVLIVCIFIF